MSTEPQLPRAAASSSPSSRCSAPTASPSRRSRPPRSSPRSSCSGRARPRATSSKRRWPPCAPPPERRATFDRLFDLHFRGSEAIEHAADGEDDETVRLQEEGRGDEEPLLSDDANESGLTATPHRGAGRAPLRASFNHRGAPAAWRARPRGVCRGVAAIGACAPAAGRLRTCAAPCATPSRSDGEILRLGQPEAAPAARASSCC